MMKLAPYPLGRQNNSRHVFSRLLSRCRPAALWAVTLLAVSPAVHAQAPIGFSASKVSGLVVGSSNYGSKATSIQFGPDDRLYFTRVDGLLIACDVTRMGPDNYAASNVEVIDLVKNIPNYDDDGAYNPGLGSRQCTGVLVVGTAADPVVYVTSCDPREGAGSGGLDLNLDTNSGTISRLTRNFSGQWEKVDIVRGLPRSEENHASNGLVMDVTGNTLYLAQGGNTNAGSPSNNFAFSAETALSAAVLSIDLQAINALPVLTDGNGQQYIYNIPTLDDPNPGRGENPDGSDVNDPFGGNDGLNQGKIVPGGPVQVYASGFRNPYDLIIAKTPGRVGNMYTFDNAANSGWGGYPKNESDPATVTNEYVPGEPGEVNNLDNLHLITGLGYYGGHPNPIRANPAGAGWFWSEDVAGQIFDPSPTSDWPPVPVSMADPQQGDFRLPGVDNGALFTNSSSTTGIGEYTAQNFDGAMVGDIITTQYNNATVQRLKLNADGTAVLESSVLLQGSAYGIPLDVAMPGPEGAPALSGTIFVAHHSNKGVTVLEPTDFDSGGGGVCTGTFSFTLDEDGDNYSNADEISNGSDPCSPAVLPSDRDGDFLSDLLDSDDDNDGIPDSFDVYPIDAANGANVAVPMNYDLFNELGFGFFSIGFTGVMADPGTDYADFIDETDIIAGGTAGLFTDPSVGPGTPHGAMNSQMNAFQFGVNSDQFSGPIRVISGLGGLLFNGTPTGAQSHGVYIGNGDQDNYLKIAVNAASGPGAIEIVHEEDGTMISQNLYPETGLFSQVVRLSFLINPIAGTVQPGYALGNGGFVDVGPPITVGGKLLEVIRGSKSMAIGLLATTGAPATPTFNATWDYFEVETMPTTAAASFTVDSGSGSIATSSTFTPGSFKIENLSSGGQNITSVVVDLTSTFLPDLVFDPAGTAGDTTGKGLQIDSFTGIGSPVGTLEDPHDGIGSADGYDTARLDFGPSVEFRPGDLLTFSSDNDPTSIKGAAPPGPSDAASISGLELSGAIVTVTFDDGSVRRIRGGGLLGVPDSFRTSFGSTSSANLSTPSLFVSGESSPFVTSTLPTVRVAGPAGYTAEVLCMDSALYIEGVAGGGYDIDPFEVNTVTSFAITEVTIPDSGYIDVAVTLMDSAISGKLNYLSAILTGPGGARSPASDPLIIDYDSVFGDTQAPTTPGVPAVSAISAGLVNLVWVPSTDDIGLAGYRILRDDVVIGFASEATFLDLGCEPLTTYEYDIVAVDLAGNESFPSSVTVSTPADLEDPSSPGLLVGLAGNESVVLSWEAATDDGRVEEYEIYRDGSLITSIPGTSYSDRGLINGQAYLYEVVAIDGAGKSSVPASLSVTPRILGPVVIRVNSGGPEFTDLAGNVWADDYGYNTGDIQTTANDIAGTDDDPLYQVTRFDRESGAELKYAFPLPNGEYEVHLHFSEVWSGASTPGVRIFDVKIEDNLEIDNFDITAQAGFETATMVPLPVVVVDGELTIEFLHVLQNPMVAGIEVFCLECPEEDLEAPSPPQSLLVSNETAGGLTLSWAAATDNVEVVGYTISREGAVIGSVSGLSFIDSGLTPTSSYLYEVTAYDAAGNDSGAATATGTTTPDATPPTMPPNLTGIPGNLSTVLRWDPSTDDAGVTGYEVYRDGVLLATVTELIFSDSGLVNGVTYNYEVIAIDSSGKSSSPAVVSVVPRILGQAVVRVNAGGGAYLDSLGNVWSPDFGYNSGEVEVSGGSIAGTEDDALYQTRRFDREGGLEMQYVFPLVDGDYEVKLHFAEAWVGAAVPGVRVFDVKIEGQLAFDDFDIVAQGGFETALAVPYPVTVTGGEISIEFIHGLQNPMLAGIEIFCVDCPEPDVESPSTPPSLIVGGTTASTVSLIWASASDNVGVVAYEVRRNGSLVQATTDLTFIDTNLIPETLYQYAVSAIDAAGNSSSPALVAGTTTADMTAPSEPPFLRGIAGDGSATLSWDPSIDDAAVVGYQIYRDGLLLTTVTGLSYVDFGLVNGQNYDFNVIALDASGKFSTPAAVIVQPRVLGPNVLRVNVGGPEVLDSAGNTWLADFGFNTGFAETSSESILGTNNDIVYQSRRFDRDSGSELKYEFDLPDGEYEVQLHFVEVWSGASSPGVRVFDVLLQGQIALSDFDIYNQFGFSTAGMTPFPVVVSDGTLSIEFQRLLQNPILAGIEIFCVSCPDPDEEAPSEPVNFVNTGVSTSTASMSWDASTDNVEVLGYRISRDGNVLATLAGLSFSDSGLLPGSTYQYTVEAFDAAGNLSLGAGLSVTTLPDSLAPSTPGALAGVAVDGFAALTWDASTDDSFVVGYEIYRDGVLLTTVTELKYTDTGLTNGQVYDYEVVAIDSTGQSSLAALITLQPLPLGPAVVRVNAAGPEHVDTEGNTWDADYGFNTGFTESSTGEIANTDEDTIFQTRRFDRSFGAELQYKFPLENGNYIVYLHLVEVWSGATSPGVRVFDVNIEDLPALEGFDIFAEAGFETAIAVPIPATVTDGELNIEFLHVLQNPIIAGIEVYCQDCPEADPESPTQPTGLVVSDLGAGSLTLSWGASTDNVAVTGYQVTRNGVVVATVTDLSYSDTALTANTLFQYEVAAVDAVGNLSDPALVDTTTLPDLTPPSIPGSLAGTGVNQTVVLTWEESTDDGAVVAYALYRYGTLIATVPELTYTDIGLDPSTAYDYDVVAIDSGSNASPPASVTVTTGVPVSLVVRVNAGGDDYLDANGNLWSADYGYNTGVGYLSSAPIGNTLEDALYQTERYDRSSGPELEYSFSVPNGDYEVKLHFAENYPSAQTLGGRVFDVAIEGVLALSDFDIFEVAGSSSAHIETILTSVTDGNLVITFDRIVQNPKISAIEFTSVEEVTPPDTTAPVITLSGDDPLVLAMGASYVDPGATALDDTDGVVTSSIIVGGDTVSTATPASFLVTYDVTDAAGNSASISRVVDVVDVVPPVITVSDLGPIVHEVGSSFVDTGATSTDLVDGVSQVNSSTAVDGSTVGTYSLTYDDTDAAGNAATQVTVIVEVVDTTAPTVVATAPNPQIVYVGDTYEDLGATATDAGDGDLTADIQVGGDVVETTAPGTYLVTYESTDSAGNAATADRTVRVVAVVAPELSIHSVAGQPNDLELSFTTVLGLDYTVYWSSNPSAVWNQLGSMIPGADEIVIIQETNTLTEGPKFYRVEANKSLAGTSEK